MRKGAETRERVLDIAETAVLTKGFGATSIDELIAEAGITKSGFFYHFKDKGELARGLLERYVAQNDALFEAIFGRARALTEDPLQAFLLGAKLLAEEMAAMPDGHPGCLVTAVTYQDRLFDRDIKEMVAGTVARWNGYFQEMFAEIAAAYPPREPVDLDQLARMVTCLIDGAIIMSRSTGQTSVLPEQILMLRTHVKLLFAPASPVRIVRPAAA